MDKFSYNIFLISAVHVVNIMSADYIRYFPSSSHQQQHLTTYKYVMNHIFNIPGTQDNMPSSPIDNPYKLSLLSSASITKYPFQIVNEWKYLDFNYPTYELRRDAIQNGKFIMENNLPLGIDVYEDRIFITTPRWKDGVPASLSTLKYPPIESSPALTPYPNWDEHSDPYEPNCHKLISVYRTYIDNCHRLWLIDSGIVNATVNLNQICPPKIVAYDLHTNQMIVHYELPAEQVKQDSLHSNIVVNVKLGNCDDAFAYVTDVWRYGLTVYSMAKHRSWRITHYNFYPMPQASDFNVYGLNFQWFDGVFGMSLGVNMKNHEEVLYFHPMASYKEFMVPTALLNDENVWNDASSSVKIKRLFQPIGDRGIYGQSSTSGITYNGVQFFTQVHRDDIGCWDTKKPYIRSNLHLILGESTRQSNDTCPTKNFIQFPNDLKVDKNYKNQGVWIMSNRLPIYLYDQLNYNEINFRILYATVQDLIQNTVCDPNELASNIISTKLVPEGQCH